MTHKEINKTQLAKKYQVDRHTIARHLDAIELGKIPRKRRECRILFYEDEIKDCLRNGDQIKSIYMSILNKDDYEKIRSYSNFKQYVNRWFSEDKIEGKKTIVRYRFETPPGELLEFDWISPLHLHLITGELVTFNVWNATLCFSRDHYYKAVETITEDDFKQCFVESLIFFQGVPKRALTDNMSAIVNIRGNRKSIHPTVQQFMKDLGVKLELCKARHAYTKGKVESSNKYQNWLDPYDYRFKDKADLVFTVGQILNQANYQVNSETK